LYQSNSVECWFDLVDLLQYRLDFQRHEPQVSRQHVKAEPHMKASNMPTKSRSRHLALVALGAWSILGSAPTAHAHPHIWVTVQTTLQFDKGTVTGIRHRWLFDEYYSTMAIQGLDANNDGIYDRKELAELATINIDGLKEMGYFTNAKLGEQPLTLDAPKDYWLDYADVDEPPGPASQIEDLSQNPPSDKPADKPSTWGKLVQKFGPAAKPAVPAKIKVLALEFTIPFATPVLAEAEGFTYGVYDPDFMIWFDLAKKDAAKLADNAPKGCTVAIDTPKSTPDLQNLSEAMFSQLGGAPGASMAKTVTLKCPKS
jgi:ABC-type uncharacterized transport system substrate-binding protein